jgi:hypothetical protein
MIAGRTHVLRSRIMRLHRLALALAVVALAGPARAADPVPDSSLKMIPADASFYSTSLRLGEQMDQFVKSTAFAKLRALPAVKVALEKFHEDAGKPDNPAGQMLQMLKDPANVELVELLADMPRQEMFIYGGPTWARLIPVLLDANWAQQIAPVKALISGQDASKAQARAALQIFNAAADKIEFPELVLGFKLTKAAPAVAQLKRLETLLTQMTANNPQLKGRVKRTKVGGADAVTFSVDGSMVPLDQIPWSDYEEHEGQFQKLRVRLKTLTLTVSLLVKNDYLMLTVGPHAGVAETLGKGPGLTSRSELAPVIKFADRNPVAISYISKALATGSSTTGENMLGMLDMVKDGLDKVGLTEKRRLAIDKDLKRLISEVIASLPKPGATVAVSFFSDHGQETYVYNYGTSPDDATPKLLSILEHLGGSPLIAIAGRVNDPTPGYRNFANWIKTIYGHLDGAAKELAPEQQYQQFQQGMEQIVPYVKRFDEITGDQFMPALGDGELALALDGKWSSKQWFEGLDQAGKDLPLLELGIVRSVADGAKLLKAFQMYRDLVNDVLTKVKETTGQDLMEGGLPKPESKKVAGGTVYFWPLPPAGQDKQVQPNFGLASRLYAVSLSTKHTERLLTSTPLTIGGGPLNDTRPALAAAVVDFGGFVKAIRPWIEQVALPMALEQMPDNAPPGVGKKDIPAQVKTMLDVLGCLRTYTSVTYKEGAATVTHSELVIRDLK